MGNIALGFLRSNDNNGKIITVPLLLFNLVDLHIIFLYFILLNHWKAAEDYAD